MEHQPGRGHIDKQIHYRIWTSRNLTLDTLHFNSLIEDCENTIKNPSNIHFMDEKVISQ